jgi:hypothetical protein
VQHPYVWVQITAYILSKALIPDNIDAKILTECKNIISYFLTIIYNTILTFEIEKKHVNGGSPYLAKGRQTL